MSADEAAFQAVVREVAVRHVAPRAAAADRSSELAAEVVHALAERHLLAMAVPREYGGEPRSSLEYALAMEELASACAATAVLVSVHNSLVAEPIVKWGTDEQRARYLPAMATGASLGAFALTEPSAGSDAASLRTRARRNGDEYRLDGSKVFITNGATAGLYLVFATLDPAAGARGIIAFLVPGGSPGLTVGLPEHKLGIRGSSTVQLYFDGCRVPAAQRLGGEGEGWRVAMSTLDSGRIGIAAQAVGIARAALQATVAYLSMTQLEAAPSQDVQWTLADMSVRVDAARLLVHRAASLKDAGERPMREAAAAKLFAAETAVWIACRAVELCGADGCRGGSLVERCYRDAKITEIYEGTSEIQRLILGEQIWRNATSESQWQPAAVH